jgi:RHS repeat-associated protein
MDGSQASDRMQYDASGNLIKDTQTQTGATGNRTYDAENRMLSADSANGLANSYVYDADGHRTRRSLNNGGEVWWQVYGIGGELVAEYQLVSGAPTLRKEYGYRHGQLLVMWDGSETGDRQLQWLVQDHLGSTRMGVDRSGSLGGVRRHDFCPFGEELSAGVGIRSASNGYGDDGVRQKFDGYERDTETGLDFAQARYYSNVQGRFTSPDPLNPIFEYHGVAFVAWLGEPQRWNKYAFALNNPLRYVDQDGEDPIEALEKASNRLSRLISRTGGNPMTIAAEVAIEAVREIWPDIAVSTGNLQYPHEREMAPLVAAFEGKSFLGIDAAGIDGIVHHGQSPSSWNPFADKGIEPVQLKNYTTDSVQNVVDNTRGIKADLERVNASRAGNEQLQGVSAFVRVNSSKITVNSLVNELKLDAQSSHGGLVGATRGNTLPKATFFLRDGVVRVQEGKIFSCNEQGRCAQR